MNAATASYVVTFSNEAGDGATYTFGPHERGAAVELYHDLAGVPFAGFPAVDVDMDLQGYYDRDTAQYGFSSCSYLPDKGGNTTVTFSAMVSDPHQRRRRFYGRGNITLGTVSLVGISMDAWCVTGPDGQRKGEVLLSHDGVHDDYATALALLGLERPFRLNPALGTFRDSWDREDPWGWGMGALSTLCDVAHVFGIEIHEGAGYRPAAGLRTVADLDLSEDTGDSDAAYLIAGIASGEVSRDDVKLAIRTVSRYLDLPDVAAGSY